MGMRSSIESSRSKRGAERRRFTGYFSDSETGNDLRRQPLYNSEFGEVYDAGPVGEPFRQACESGELEYVCVCQGRPD
jgi:hypothetical protein